MPMVGGLAGFEPRSTSEVSFLLGSEASNILNEIAMLEAEISVTFDLITERSRMHRHEVQVKLEEAEVSQDVELSEEQLKEILGERLFITMVDSTEQLISSVESVMLGCGKAIENLSTELRKQFPGEAIIKMQPVESDASADQGPN